MRLSPLLVALLVPPRASAQTDAAYDRGREAYQDGRYADAIECP